LARISISDWGQWKLNMQRDAFFLDLVFGLSRCINRYVGGRTDWVKLVFDRYRYSFFDYPLGWKVLFWLRSGLAVIGTPYFWTNVSLLKDRFPSFQWKTIAQGGFDLTCQGGRRKEYYITHAYAAAVNFICLSIIKQQDPFNHATTWEHNVLGSLWYWEYGNRGIQPKNVCPNNEAIIDLVGISLEVGIRYRGTLMMSDIKARTQNSGGSTLEVLDYLFLFMGMILKNRNMRI